MVVHFFEVKMSHLSPSLMKAFIQTFNKMEQKVVLYVDDNLLFGDIDQEKQKYEKVLKEESFTNYKYVYSKDNLLLEIIGVIKNGDKCVLHGYFVLYKTFYNLIKLFFVRKYLSNIFYVHWGVENLNKDNFKKKIFYYLASWLYSNFAYNLVLVDGDKVLLDGFYKLNNVVVCPYFSTLQGQKIAYKIKKNEAKKDKVKVIISHSGHIHNNHKEALDILKRNFDSVISEITLPLCYGPKEYIDEIIFYGKQLFGNRFYYFTKLLPNKEYYEFIRSKDIFISAAKNQTGLGASQFAFGNGLKVFRTGLCYEDHKKNGLVVYKFEDLYCMDVRDFVLPLSDIEIKRNFDIVCGLNNPKIEKWRNLLFC